MSRQNQTDPDPSGRFLAHLQDVNADVGPNTPWVSKRLSHRLACVCSNDIAELANSLPYHQELTRAKVVELLGTAWRRGKDATFAAVQDFMP